MLRFLIAAVAAGFPVVLVYRGFLMLRRVASSAPSRAI
jgi:hypothetical protein